MNHTKGLLAVNHDRIESKDDHGWINDGWIIAQCQGPDAVANARRLVACWNALNDVPTDVIEGSAIFPPEISYKDLRKQRDELLSALRRQFKADDTLYAMPSDCDKEAHEKAMKEHYASYVHIAALLITKYKEEA